MTSSNKLLCVAILGFAIGIATVLWPGRTLPQTSSLNLPLDSVADYIHAVIEADRDLYTRHVVERMQAKGIVVASENWEERNTLPLPAQFLMESGRHTTGHRRDRRPVRLRRSPPELRWVTRVRRPPGAAASAYARRATPQARPVRSARGRFQPCARGCCPTGETPDDKG